jgi:hypothetical protein
MKISMAMPADVLAFREGPPPEGKTLIEAYSTACCLRPFDVIVGDNIEFLVTGVVEEDDEAEEGGPGGPVTVYVLHYPGNREATIELPSEVAHTHFITIVRWATEEEIDGYEQA